MTAAARRAEAVERRGEAVDRALVLHQSRGNIVSWRADPDSLALTPVRLVETTGRRDVRLIGVREAELFCEALASADTAWRRREADTYG